MATILLGAAASAVAGSAGLSTLGSLALSASARLVGGVADGALAGSITRHREGARLEDLAVQSSAYGKAIPIVYGSARMAGNIIWSQPIKEVATTTTTTQSGGKGGGSVSSSSTEYSYYVTLAIAICEGEIDEIQRVWADAKQLDLGLGEYRLYKGGEGQLPDPLIESVQGVGNTPAYRGLAYVVIEEFPLADFGNRIPNFTFEVKRKQLYPDFEGEAVEEMVRSVVMIPGSGEYVYDMQIAHKVEGEEVEGEFVQRGERTRINAHTPFNVANAEVALDQLAETLPNLEWVAVVANWFGTSMDAADCSFVPKVEFNSAEVAPEPWSVAGYSRQSAPLMTYENDSPRYGGTPDDESLQRFVDALKARGYKVLFIPMPLMDVPAKPWRGRLTGTPQAVADMFTRSGGYNDFVLHYAQLMQGRVDAFAIGSELIGLTKVHDGANVNRSFPGVDALVSLAASAKAVLGGAVKVTYAADWSEYHHTDGGWYNMDALWASPYIDVIGIDAYFPLTEDVPQNELGYEIDAVMQGWESGEGYSYYYSDAARTTKAPLDAPYAWKNMAWFWENVHVNPDGNSTAWTPQSKKIWFTEYGFPSVDGATNQPNVFYDPSSSESFFPRASRGRVDFRAQRTGIAGTEAKWKNSPMVERQFLWTWDARPYPYWPDLRQVWADGPVWKSGHWVQGKLGLSGLAAIVADICQRAGLPDGVLDVSRLKESVEGFIVTQQTTARRLIEQLMGAYFFDVVESNGVLKCMPRGNASVLNVPEGQLVPANSEGDAAAPLLEITRAQELELPEQLNVVYINRLSNYQPNTQSSQRQNSLARGVETLSLPIVFSDQRAKTIADVALYNAWLGRVRYQFQLPMAYAALEPTDVITLEHNGIAHVVRITQLRYGKPGLVQVQAVAEDVGAYDFYIPPGEGQTALVDAPLPGETELQLLDMPALPSDAPQDAMMRLAAVGLGDSWRGAVVYRSDDNGQNYGRFAGFSRPSVTGVCATALDAGHAARWQELGELTVLLQGDVSLSSATELAVLNGANAALVGDEIIQFQYAEAVLPGKYRLRRLLRGRLGTEYAMANHVAGERFVLLDDALEKQAVSDALLHVPRLYKPVSVGASIGQTQAQSFTLRGRSLLPYAPVHVHATREEDGAVLLRWVRRSRGGGAWRDYGDAPLNEVWERYEIEVLDVQGSVVRMLESKGPQVRYEAAEQVADFGAVQDALEVRVYQLSEKAGRGYAAQASV